MTYDELRRLSFGRQWQYRVTNILQSIEGCCVARNAKEALDFAVETATKHWGWTLEQITEVSVIERQ